MSKLSPWSLLSFLVRNCQITSTYHVSRKSAASSRSTASSGSSSWCCTSSGSWRRCSTWTRGMSSHKYSSLVSVVKKNRRCFVERVNTPITKEKASNFWVDALSRYFDYNSLEKHSSMPSYGNFNNSWKSFLLVFFSHWRIISFYNTPSK